MGIIHSLSTTRFFSRFFSNCGKELFINSVDKLEEWNIRTLKSGIANFKLEFRLKFNTSIIITDVVQQIPKNTYTLESDLYNTLITGQLY